jgi:hypothetical protein
VRSRGVAAADARSVRPLRDDMVNREDLNETAQVLLDMLLAEFPGWTELVEPYSATDDPEAESGNVRLVVPSLAHPGHDLEIALRGNAVQVAYSDGRPPGPAEHLVLIPAGAATAACIGVRDFVRDVIEERRVIVREPLGWVARALRRDGCTDLPWFRSVDEVTAAPRRYPVVYSWMGRFSHPPVSGAA